MMVLHYCNGGNLRNHLNKSNNYIYYRLKIDSLLQIARGLLDIHNAGKVHKDFHSGNILNYAIPLISDLGMCQPANKQPVKEEGVYGVLPYMAPEVLRGHQYTKAADIYSFGIIMNEFLSEEIPYNDIPHNEFLAIKICKGLRPKISNDVPKLLADLIIKCWDAEIENRPTAKELYKIFDKWYDEVDIYSDDSYDSYDSEDNEDNEDNEDGKGGEDDKDGKDGENSEDSQNNKINFQVKKCDKIGRKKFKTRSNEDKSKNIQTHPQAIYTSRLLNFKNLPKPVNSSDLSSFQFNSGNIPIFYCDIYSTILILLLFLIDANYAVQSTLANPSKYFS
jgi:serine/threonine protein kinase